MKNYTGFKKYSWNLTHRYSLITATSVRKHCLLSLIAFPEGHASRKRVRRNHAPALPPVTLNSEDQMKTLWTHFIQDKRIKKWKCHINNNEIVNVICCKRQNISCSFLYSCSEPWAKLVQKSSVNSMNFWC